jgi:hypothetical protein
MASYAMLLRSSPTALSSPRNNPTEPAVDVRKSWRDCIEAPAELKSFSFARLCLLPALQTNTPQAEFFLAVLAEFAAHYLQVLSASGDRPISRAKWEQDAEEDLRLRRSHQENQRQFHAWSGTTNAASDQNNIDNMAVPDAVDLAERPDCMDDVIAFCTAVCVCLPECALLFWSRGDDDNDNKLVPSRALLDLRDQQTNDDTLRASFLSFLAALALAKNDSLDGAHAVHELLLQEGTANTWPALLEMVRWYARELGSPSSTRGSTSSAGTVLSGGNNSSAYYYNDDNDINNNSNYGLSTGPTLASEGPAKSRELGEENAYLLLSHLVLISNVAKGCPAARSAILSVRFDEEDSTLTVLISLAVTALPPDVRGQVFGAVAELLNLDAASLEVSTQIREAAGKTWELLEACQILPIHLLEQYASSAQSSDSSGTITGLAFPPSSTALVSPSAVSFPRFAVESSRVSHSSFSTLLFCRRGPISSPNPGYQRIRALRSSTKWNTLNLLLVCIRPREGFCCSSSHSSRLGCAHRL